MIYSLTIKGHFDAAHFLRGYQGKCQFLHGHTFFYEVQLEGNKLDELGMLIDFVEVKKILKEVVEEGLDHKFLNEVFPFTELNPTAENLAKVIFEKLTWQFMDPVKIKQVTIWESQDAGVTYSE